MIKRTWVFNAIPGDTPGIAFLKLIKLKLLYEEINSFEWDRFHSFGKSYIVYGETYRKCPIFLINNIRIFRKIGNPLCFKNNSFAFYLNIIIKLTEESK